ncbi:MAG: hypothetical protein ACTSRK_04030 [Promethearchaeota archaeon]
MSDIKAIITSSTAEESSEKYFQTINLLLARFKRSQNRQEIYKLTTTKNTVSNFLIGACAIQCYHYVGIRTKSKEIMISRETNENIQEAEEKQDLYEEISQLFKDSLSKEIDLLLEFLSFEKKIIENMINIAGLQQFSIDESLRDELEDFLYSSFQIYADVFWLDDIGEWIGYKKMAKKAIIKSSLGIKPTSVDLEKRLVNEALDDKYMELSTIKLIYNRIKKDFKFKSMREFHSDREPIKKITNLILDYQMTRYPLSEERLSQFLKGTEFKITFFKKLQDANSKKINFEDLESDLKLWIIQQIKENVAIHPSNFDFFLQNLLDMNKNELHIYLNQLGFQNIDQFSEIQGFETSKFLHDVNLNQLSRLDFIKFEENNQKLGTIQKFIDQIYSNNNLKDSKTLAEILVTNDEFELEILHQACSLAKLDLKFVKDIYMKRVIISSTIQPKYPISGHLSNYSLLYDIDMINTKIGNKIYFTLFAKICVQIARIYESFAKVKDDKGIILLGLKRIFDSTEEEDWIRVKIEELIIQRLLNRQEEIAFVLDAQNQSFFVNSFIYARLFDTTLNRARKIFQEEPAQFYADVAEIKLPAEKLSPVSYIFAYEILERFKLSRLKIRDDREKVHENNEESEKKKKEKFKSEQQLSTLNWIERKITTSLVSISAVTVNPTSFYWSEKDSKMALEGLLIHAKLGSRQICDECGVDATTTPCVNHPSSNLDASPLDLTAQFYSFTLNRIHHLWPKIKIPTFSELRDEIRGYMQEEMEERLNLQVTREISKKILDGELRDVGFKVVKRIGKYLDKAIYKKFKANLRKNRQS